MAKGILRSGHTVEVLEIVGYRRRNVHCQFDDGGDGWFAEEDFSHLPGRTFDWSTARWGMAFSYLDAMDKPVFYIGKDKEYPYEQSIIQYRKPDGDWAIMVARNRDLDRWPEHDLQGEDLEPHRDDSVRIEELNEQILAMSSLFQEELGDIASKADDVLAIFDKIKMKGRDWFDAEEKISALRLALKLDGEKRDEQRD